MTNQNDQTCTEHGTVLDSYFVAAEPHPNGGIVPAHEELSCSDCQLEDMSPEDFREIEPIAALNADSYVLNIQPAPQVELISTQEALRMIDAVGKRKLVSTQASLVSTSTYQAGRHEIEHIKNFKCSACTKPAPKPAAKIKARKVYADEVIGSRFVSTKTRSFGHAVNVLDHHILADHYGSLPIVRESEIEDLLTDPESVDEVVEFGFVADDWAEIETLRNKQISKEAGLVFDSNK